MTQRPVILARSVRGLEWVVADEVSERLPAATGIAMSGRAVTFQLPELDPGAASLRCADDVFLQVGAVAEVGRGKAALPAAARRIAGLDWASAVAQLARVRDLPPGPAFDVVASLSGRPGYSRFALENAIGGALAPLLGGTHLARTSDGRQAGEPDLTVRLFTAGPAALAALRLAGRPLHRRGYKQATGPGTLHPPLAAALARLAAPAGPGPAVVADPFCGDGTIAIETALSYPQARVIAGDIDAARLANAAGNAARAGIRARFCLLDAGQLPWAAGSVDAVITNPPWGVTVGPRGLLHHSLEAFWRQLPGLLTPAGRVSLVTDAELGAPARLRGLGYQLALAAQVRLAGRISHLLLAGPPGRPGPRLPEGLARWRRLALAEGLVTEDGF